MLNTMGIWPVTRLGGQMMSVAGGARAYLEVPDAGPDRALSIRRDSAVPKEWSGGKSSSAYREGLVPECALSDRRINPVRKERARNLVPQPRLFERNIRMDPERECL